MTSTFSISVKQLCSGIVKSKSASGTTERSNEQNDFYSELRLWAGAPKGETNVTHDIFGISAKSSAASARQHIWHSCLGRNRGTCRFGTIFFDIWESRLEYFSYWRCSWGGGRKPHRLQGFWHHNLQICMEGKQ